MPFDKWSAKADQLFLNQDEKIDCICLNLGAVIGPEDNIISPMGNFFISYLKGDLKLVPEGGYPWISIDDVIKVIEKSLSIGKNHKQYIVANEWLTLNDVLNSFKIHSGTNHKYKLSSIKKLLFLGLILNPIFKLFKLKLIPTKTLIAMTRHKLFSSERVKSEFGIEFKSINRTLEECANFYSSKV